MKKCPPGTPTSRTRQSSNVTNPYTMSHCELASKPLLQCLRQTCGKGLPVIQLQSIRSFQTTAIARDEVQAEAKKEPFYKAPDPALVTSPRLEKRLLKSGVSPIGSRRRRAALQDSPNIPFEQLPYQCFQEARKVLLADREEKLKEIARERDRIARLRALSDEEAGGEIVKKSRLGAMEKHLERLKILADINDPLVKKRFEDGQGRLSMPFNYF
jgi:large subunit ribosomal protein L35